MLFNYAKKAFGLCLIGILSAALALPAVALGADLSVTVKKRVEIKGKEIRLNDLAVITGPDGALKRDLGQVFITNAPPPGRNIKIQRDYIAHRLRASGLPLNLVKWNLPQTVFVTRASRTLKADFVRKVLDAYCSRTEPYKSGDWELVNLKTGQLPVIPVGELTYKVVPESSSNAVRITLTIYLNVNGEAAGKVRASARINLFGRVAVAVRTMEKGSVIKASDLKIARVNLNRVRKSVIRDPRQALGMSCRRRIHQGQPVFERDLIKHAAVKRGDMVTIVAESGALRVSTAGRAKENGSVGDNIAVINLNSKKVIMAQIVDQSTVRVNF